MKITNPVLTGFHADPSMIRVKDTYYIANSTFEWFPGIRLHESKDMVHWNTLPYPLGAEQLDMRGDPASGGVWAPDLSYADGRFWIVYSDVHIVNGAFKDVVNYLTTAEDIRGPWSKPLRLNGVGFDASLFHDDDGRKYLVQQTWDHREYKHQFHGITLTEFDTATMRLKPETARTIWMGDDVKLVEGPHLYKINGWYYLFCAEGGTVWTHQESVARSRTLDELSFEASPTNPFITNFDIPGSYLQKQGHGALVARRWQAFDFDAETCVAFDPKTYQAMAGLTNYYNDQHWSWAFVTYDEDRKCRVIEVAQNDRNNYTSFLRENAVVVPEGVDRVWLRAKVRTQWYAYEYSFDGETWTELPVRLDARILSDDYVNQTYGGFFTGAFVGLAAVDYSGYGEVATFDHFDYREISGMED